MTDDRYKWVALSRPRPAVAGNISYLLWMIMGYRLVQAVLVVALGRLGDMFGRVRMYNADSAVFADHLAAGHLAAAAWLRLQPDPA
jgi:MFS family permease